MKQKILKIDRDDSGRTLEGPFPYLLGEFDSEGRRREIAPIVIRGNADTADALLKSGFSRTPYVSGVFSFVESWDRVSTFVSSLMLAFEAFASVPTSRRISWTWILHQTAEEPNAKTPEKRVELHWVAVNLDMQTLRHVRLFFDGSKADRLLLSTFEDWANVRFNLHAPSDAAPQLHQVQRRWSKPARELAEEARNIVECGIQAGTVKNAITVETVLAMAGFKVSRGTYRERPFFRVARSAKDSTQSTVVRLHGWLWSPKFEAGLQPQKWKELKRSKEEEERLWKELNTARAKRLHYWIGRGAKSRRETWPSKEIPARIEPVDIFPLEIRAQELPGSTALEHIPEPQPPTPPKPRSGAKEKRAAQPLENKAPPHQKCAHRFRARELHAWLKRRNKNRREPGIAGMVQNDPETGRIEVNWDAWLGDEEERQELEKFAKWIESQDPEQNRQEREPEHD